VRPPNWGRLCLQKNITVNSLDLLIAMIVFHPGEEVDRAAAKKRKE